MSIDRWFYRFRAYLVSPPLFFAVFCSYQETETFVWPLGISVFILGFALRLWAQQHLHYRLRVHKHLSTTGPYGFVRNPVYIGNVLIGLGATLISELLWLVPITFFWYSIVYRFVVRYEETHLLEKYGQPYREYMSRVPRWFPRSFSFSRLELGNKYFLASTVKEVHCFLILLPYIIKEFVAD
jgi:protein-S-isoprenylcysteine O-methyltransferase Ste14